MGEVEREISKLMMMLDRMLKEAESSASVMEELDRFLEQESSAIIQESLDRLLSEVENEVTQRAGSPVFVRISPTYNISIEEIHGDVDSNPYVMRLRSEGFIIKTISDFSTLVEALKSRAAGPKRVDIIEFLMANVNMR